MTIIDTGALWTTMLAEGYEPASILEIVREIEFRNAAESSRDALREFATNPGPPGPDDGGHLAHLWGRCRTPSAIGTGRLTRLFERTGFVTDTPGTSPPAGPIAIYRGIAAGGLVRGMSWTTDRAQASRFAHRFLEGWDDLWDADFDWAAFDGPDFDWDAVEGHPDAQVWAATIPPPGVLAIFLRRREAEVVVNPRRLRGVRLLPTAPP